MLQLVFFNTFLYTWLFYRYDSTHVSKDDKFAQTPHFLQNSKNALTPTDNMLHFLHRLMFSDEQGVCIVDCNYNDNTCFLSRNM